MRNVLFLILMVVYSVSARYIDTIKTVQPAHLVQLLTFGIVTDSAYDSSGAGNHWNGQYAAINHDSSGINPGEKASYMNGSTAYIVTNPKTTVAQFNHNEGSAIVWVKSSEATWGGTGGTGGVKTLLEYKFNTTNYFHVFGKTGVGIIYNCMSKNVLVADTVAYTNDGIFKNWIFIAVTWSTTNNRVTFYVDGKQRKASFAYSGWTTPITVLYNTVGCDYGGYCFKGKVSFNALWNVELSWQEIARLAINHKIITGIGFGNSNTYGALVTYPWIWRIQQRFGDTCLILNRGISGTVLQNTLSYVNNGRDRYVSDVLNCHPDYVFCAYGLNDLRSADTAINVRNFSNDLREVIIGLKSGGIDSNKIVMCNPPRQRDYSSASPYNGGSVEKQAVYTDSIKNICSSLHVKFVNLYDSMLIYGDTAALLLSDGIHLNDSCHSLLARMFFNSAITNAIVTNNKKKLQHFFNSTYYGYNY